MPACMGPSLMHGPLTHAWGLMQPVFPQSASIRSRERIHLGGGLAQPMQAVGIMRVVSAVLARLAVLAVLLQPQLLSPRAVS